MKTWQPALRTLLETILGYLGHYSRFLEVKEITLGIPSPSRSIPCIFFIG